MEGTNRFKGYNLIDRVPEKLWTEVLNIVQEAVIKTSPKQKTRWLSEESLKIAGKRREMKGKGEKERYTHLNAEFLRMQGEIRKTSPVISAKKQRKIIEWERLEISSRKLEIPREHFMQR